jgi:RNA polymerase sigma-70 factor (ECF subfamily)
MTRLRAEMSDAGKLDQFESLKFCLTGEKAAYADVARQLGITEGAVKVAVHRLRARYRALLRAEIAETVATAEEVEDELRHLFAALSA